MSVRYIVNTNSFNISSAELINIRINKFTNARMSIVLYESGKNLKFEQ